MTAHINSFMCLPVVSWFPSNQCLCGRIFKPLLPTRHTNKRLFRCALPITASSMTCLDRFLKALGNNIPSIAWRELDITAKTFLVENVQYFQHLKLISKRLTSSSETRKDRIEHGKRNKKGVYICFVCRRDLLFCSLILVGNSIQCFVWFWNIFTTKMQYYVSNILALVSLNYNK